MRDEEIIHRLNVSLVTSLDEAQRTGSNARVCPDLLRYEQIGVADNMRGHVVRAFFWLMRAWPT